MALQSALCHYDTSVPFLSARKFIVYRGSFEKRMKHKTSLSISCPIEYTTKKIVKYPLIKSSKLQIACQVKFQQATENQRLWL
jgi:hypothetical protein